LIFENKAFRVIEWVEVVFLSSKYIIEQKDE